MAVTKKIIFGVTSWRPLSSFDTRRLTG